MDTDVINKDRFRKSIAFLRPSLEAKVKKNNVISYRRKKQRKQEFVHGMKHFMKLRT